MVKKNKRAFRVKMVIYDDIETSVEQPLVWSDEPLYESPDEIAHQAYRLAEQLENKLYEAEPEDAGSTLPDEDAGSSTGAKGVGRVPEEFDS